MNVLIRISLAALCLCAALQASAREIALTFDDAPQPDTTIMTGAERTDKLIKVLKDAKVPDALFFVTTKNITEQNKHRLTQYTQAGFHLANHSHSHSSAAKLGVNDYLSDAYKAHLILKDFDNRLPFHRFPYLHYGADASAVEKLQAGLGELGYKDGYVTVDNFDWAISGILSKAAEEEKTIDYAKASALYVDTLEQAIEFYDALAQKTLKRSPKHILLLHENDAAALFLPDLIARLRSKGWKIISPQDAYKDPIAKQKIFHKQGRIAGIAASKGVAEAELRHESENMEYLEALFKERKVFE
jgi:peptidoglycan/xylan/chitin deacetylase (PgdA/CDA1 family)